MEYTVKALAELAKVTSRTLRWYDRMGLLKPGRISSAGYRLYGPAEVNRLQQILFYRELGLPLAEIRAILNTPDFDRQAALQSHLLALQERREQLDALIRTVERTLLNEKGEITMSDKEKFEGFKRQKVEENEQLYGKEVRKKHGDGPMEAANKAMLGLAWEEYQRWESLDKELRERLAAAVRAGESPEGKVGVHLARLHREWRTILMPDCDDARQMGIAELYMEDLCFTAYYDREVSGCTQFLRDAVRAHILSRG